MEGSARRRASLAPHARHVAFLGNVLCDQGAFRRLEL